MQIRHAFVGQNQQLVVGLLQNGHSLAVNLELFAMETDLGFATFLNIALELINDFVLLLMPFVLSLDGLHICAVVGLFDLFLQ